MNRKTIFGFSKTLCDIVDAVSRNFKGDSSANPYFNNFVTNFYKLSCFKSVTNLFFVLSTKIDNLDYSDLLKRYYQQIYIEYISKNVLHDQEATIHLPLFRAKTEEFLKGALRGEGLKQIN